jgi:hypothetical protein
LQIINTSLMKHPLNWVVITLMLLIAGIALHLVMQALGFNASKSGGNPASVGNVPADASATARDGNQQAG